MSFIGDFFVGILIGYLALTNMLADSILSIFPINTPDEIEEQTGVPESTDIDMPSIASEYRYGGSIPDILLRSASYQKATVINGITSISNAGAEVEEALVNIYCTYTTDTFVRTTTGTGFFVHPGGVILTNAHVAQFLLLETVNNTGETDCIIRSGTPAVPTYEADLLYISPAWVSKHASIISSTTPQGTGERDYALLYVTSGLDNNPMPRVFPFLGVDTNLLSRHADESIVVAAGYPAESAIKNDGDVIQLIPKRATTSIADLFTFGSNFADIFSIRESSVGEQGSSGGPVINSDGDVIGIIVTKGNPLADGEKSLRALTLSYINRTIKEETGFSFLDSLGGDLPFRAKIFGDTLVPFLSAILERELGG